MFILITAVLFLTGCGRKNLNLAVVDEPGVETSPRYTEIVDNTSRPKRQPAKTTVAAEESPEALTAKNSGAVTNTTVSAVQTGTQTKAAATAIVDNESDELVHDPIKTETPEVPDIPDMPEVPDDPDPVQEPEEIYYLDGIVYEVRDKYIVINESDFKMVQVSVSDTSKIEGISVGDTVEITYNGLLNDGVVKYAYDAYSIEVIKTIGKECRLEHYEHNSVSFSLLVPEGWNSKVIDYPQEGDFTDWGVRFTPDGAAGSMDVTWHSSISIAGSFDKSTIITKGMSVKRYSRNGVWRFFVFENNYMTTNNFFETPQHDQYADDMELMFNTLEFY